VIPIWATTATPTVFDETANVGGATFDQAGDLDARAAEIAELFGKKLDSESVPLVGQTTLAL